MTTPGNTTTYRCSKCGAVHPRESLVVKRVQFQTMGRNWRTLKSRVTDWLCPDCREADPAWQAKLRAYPAAQKREKEKTDGQA
jgi:predicted RNA-binding Zn-ribbon protein involved in translation (DUF1610 family)